MDVATLAGILLGLFLIIGSIMMASSLTIFVHVPSLMITFGGTIAATLINYPLGKVLSVFKVAKNVSKALISALNADGTNIFVANGAVAGQKAPHVMVHVIPRKDADGITALKIPKNQMAPEDQEKLRVAIRKQVNEKFGLADEPEPVVTRPEPEKVESSVAAEDDEPEEQQMEEPAEEADVEEEDDGEPEEMVVPPPEPKPHEFKKHAEEENRPKKPFDLDSISNMFK